jgi:hypothetical protein
MMMMMKLLTAAALALGFAVSGDALAHGPSAPKHGGVVQAAGDLSFELVPRDEGALIYIEDHGKPALANGMSGKLTVLNGSDKSEATLTSSGDKLEAKGVKLGSGAKAVATLTTADKKTITVRFTVK